MCRTNFVVFWQVFFFNMVEYYWVLVEFLELLNEISFSCGNTFVTGIMLKYNTWANLKHKY